MPERNPSEHEETHEERLNRELEQLLHELRVAMPGVPVLFAFLLTVPFQQRFAQVMDDLLFRKTTVTVTVAATGALFIGLWFVLGLVRRTAGEPSH